MFSHNTNTLTLKRKESLLLFIGYYAAALLVLPTWNQSMCSDHLLLLSGSITPIFTMSSVTGESLDLIKVFLNIIPPLSNSKEQEELMQQLTEFQVWPWWSLIMHGSDQLAHRHSCRRSVNTHVFDWHQCALLQVDEIYTVPEVGTVVGGTLSRSVCENANLIFICTLLFSVYYGLFLWPTETFSECAVVFAVREMILW